MQADLLQNSIGNRCEDNSCYGKKSWTGGNDRTRYADAMLTTIHGNMENLSQRASARMFLDLLKCTNDPVFVHHVLEQVHQEMVQLYIQTDLGIYDMHFTIQWLWVNRRLAPLYNVARIPLSIGPMSASGLPRHPEFPLGPYPDPVTSLQPFIYNGTPSAIRNELLNLPHPITDALFHNDPLPFDVYHLWQHVPAQAVQGPQQPIVQLVPHPPANIQQAPQPQMMHVHHQASGIIPNAPQTQLIQIVPQAVYLKQPALL